MNLKINIDNRSRKQYVNILLSLGYRGIMVLCSFLIVPLSLSFLSKSSYGVWLTIYSILGWTTFFDLGLGNGMKNILSEALVNNDSIAAKKIVSTSYIMILFIAITLIIIFCTISFSINIDWPKFLNVRYSQLYIQELILISFVLFAIKLLLDTINSILLTYQRASVTYLIAMISSILSLGSILLLFQINIPSDFRLLALGITLSTIPVLVLLCFSIVMFWGKYKEIRPSFAFFDKQYLKTCFSLGGQFFIIQISFLVIFSTSNILIARLFTPEQVTIYNIAYKLFNSFLIIWTIIITPYWTAFGEAYLRHDHTWIKKTVTNLLYLWILMLIVLVITLQYVDSLYALWIGPNLYIPYKLSLAMALFVALSAFTNIFAYFINGVGKIRLQLISSVVAAAMNIPLAIYLSKYLEIGITGIVLATSISISFGAFTGVLQYRRIMSNKISGIWNK